MIDSWQLTGIFHTVLCLPDKLHFLNLLETAIVLFGKDLKTTLEIELVRVSNLRPGEESRRLRSWVTSPSSSKKEAKMAMCATNWIQFSKSTQKSSTKNPNVNTFSFSGNKKKFQNTISISRSAQSKIHEHLARKLILFLKLLDFVLLLRKMFTV